MSTSHKKSRYGHLKVLFLNGIFGKIYQSICKVLFQLIVEIILQIISLKMMETFRTCLKQKGWSFWVFLKPLFFAFDHCNYSRWLPIHVRDMVQLETKQPGVFREFMEGNLVVQRSHHKFSMIGKDQSHEQTKFCNQLGYIQISLMMQRHLRSLCWSPQIHCAS